jgi:ribosomal protein S27AE
MKMGNRRTRSDRKKMREPYRKSRPRIWERNNRKRKCPKCGSRRTYENWEYYACNKCGYINKKIMKGGEDWKW